MQTKESTQFLAHITKELTREYILAYWSKRDWVKLIERLLDQPIAGSTA